MTTLSTPVNFLDHAQGPANAPVTLVEYGDYQSKQSRLLHPVLKEIKFVMRDRLRYVFRHFPSGHAHPAAFQAALAAEAAGRQGKFWQMHDLIFNHNHVLNDESVLLLASQIGLNIPLFKIDLLDENLIDKIDADYDSGTISGVKSAPAIFINGERHVGPPDYLSLMEAIEENTSLVY
jgi:protein-disulfide isomerase